MRFIVGILCFLCAVVIGLKIQGSRREYLVTLQQAARLSVVGRAVNHTGEGGVYERPIDTCVVVNSKLTKCHCNPPAYVDGVINAVQLLAVVCTVKCSDPSTCPEPPVGEPLCHPFGECLIKCDRDQDCPGPNGVCQEVDQPKGRACWHKHL
ncbi:hypothetical protein FOZ61_010695 [Perkinsus olseni]|uniref:Uncharacterized protein n=1 Tax=Perkinsus olseni TaxID=32597 RepID=A0A7J6MHK5_PEROL|nr:hypothetical protein FOZ61_010695 [Perkinsus olseni]KAF4675918.1 hypothetical protein FOL46_009134 [Perkinsus olseni]